VGVTGGSSIIEKDQWNKIGAKLWGSGMSTDVLVALYSSIRQDQGVAKLDKALEVIGCLIRGSDDERFLCIFRGFDDDHDGSLSLAEVERMVVCVAQCVHYTGMLDGAKRWEAVAGKEEAAAFAVEDIRGVLGSNEEGMFRDLFQMFQKTKIN
jgi:Ca2+-binding EF-hand superfamily protein